MNISQLLAMRESQTVELKAAPILAKPASVAREVVGMLNSLQPGSVGTIWIGVSEKEGQAVHVDGVEDPEGARSKLRDHLFDTIEPRIGPDQVTVTACALDDGPTVLRVEIQSGADRKPFAVLFQGGRHYWRRVQDRLASMTYDELRYAWNPSRDHSVPTNKALESLEKSRKEAQDREQPLLWMGIAPTRPLALDFADPNIKNLLTEARSSSNRARGWTFVRHARGLKPFQSGLRLGTVENGRTDLFKTAQIDLQIPLEFLKYGPRRAEGSDRELYPLALIEYPTSLLRLAAALMRAYGQESKPDVIVGFCLSRVRGWELWPYSPSSIDWHEEFHGHGEFDDGDDFVVEPLTFAFDDLVANPDACALRLLRQVYEAFHLEEDKLPYEFDREQQRLLLD